MVENNIQLKITRARIIPLCRVMDSYLMDKFRKLENLSDEDLYDINRVRIFLQVMMLSDIVDSLGWEITSEAFNG